MKGLLCERCHVNWEAHSGPELKLPLEGGVMDVVQLCWNCVAIPVNVNATCTRVCICSGSEVTCAVF